MRGLACMPCSSVEVWFQCSPPMPYAVRTIECKWILSPLSCAAAGGILWVCFFLAVVVVFVNKLYQLNGTVAR